jgi:transmembrane sensor
MAAGGTHLEHQLPDGSQIALNAGSRIRYDQNNFGSERKVNLDGEAFFSVVKGSKFVVSTRNGNVTVLGTSFNVYSRDNEFIVTCVTGKVKVTSDDASIVINPGESSRLSDGKLVSSTVNNTEATTGWIKGEFTYENSPLNQVLGEIERQFNIKFVGGNFDSRYFTGTFTNKDLKNTLDIVCIPMGLTYAVGDKGKILIQEKTRQ